MTTTPSGFGLNHSVSQWSRRFGISVRPWSGTSPGKLLSVGVVRLVLCGLLVWLSNRLATDEELAQLGDQLGQTGARPPIELFAIGLLIIGVIVGVLGLVRVVAGIIDLVSSREVSGVVVSLGDRQAFDVLPGRLVRWVLLRHRDHYDDDRDMHRYRTELVVDTASGRRQWTIRKYRAVRDVRPGMSIRMRVTPIAGYVSKVQILNH